MTTCLDCGSEMTIATEDHAYVEAGLSAVTLLGVEVRLCPQCGETELVLPALESIHRQIMSALVSKEGRLAPEEMRFLRRYAGYSGADMARRVGVAPETLSRWEHGARDVGVGSDRFLRVIVMATVGETLHPAAFLTMASTDDATPLRLDINCRPRAAMQPAVQASIPASTSATVTVAEGAWTFPARQVHARATTTSQGEASHAWSPAA